MNSFAVTLKLQREQRRVSQSRLAEWADFDHSYISRLETGSRLPTKDAIDRIADAMGSTPENRDILLSSAGYLPNNPTSVFSDHPEIQELWMYLNDENVPLERRKATRSIVRNLLRAIGD